MKPDQSFLSGQLEMVSPSVRPMIEGAIRTVKEIAPDAEEIAYRGGPPSSSRAMWKLVRYSVAGANIVGIGAFSNHATLWFYRGRELDDGTGLLQGGGKESRFVTLRAPGDSRRAAVKRLVREAFERGRSARKTAGA